MFFRKHVYPLNKITNIFIFTEKVLENLEHTEIILQLRHTKFLRNMQHTQELYWNNQKKFKVNLNNLSKMKYDQNQYLILLKNYQMDTFS